MAQRRMFSPDIVGSDAFLDMPVSSQALYFHLGMYADDDGFVNPKRIMRMIGVSEDDLKILISKRFVLPFENGVVVVKHWKINNLVRKDWYKPTQYLEQRKALFIKETGAYTFDSLQGKPFVNESLPSPLTQVRLGKDILIGSQSEHDSSLEEREVAITPDGEPILGKPAKKTSAEAEANREKNKLIMKIRAKFNEMCFKATDHNPNYQDKKSFVVINRALKVLKPRQIIDLFDDWFDSGRPDEELIHITRALSSYQIENYRLNHDTAKN